MKPSIFTQLENCTPVGARLLKPSPRTWNPGLMRYKDRLWMCYRYHLKEEGGRCATAICELNPTTFQPAGPSQQIKFIEQTGTEHFEDARLFIFRGEPHISFTSMIGYVPGKDYRCTMQYAKLRLRGARWEVVEQYRPSYGQNGGGGKEKNWVFFEHENTLHCVYSGHPKHVTLQLDGDRVTSIYEAQAPVWNFGEIRGGTPPIRIENGNFISVFHSSTHSEPAPNHVRYYAAAYEFTGQPPFDIIRISKKPIMAGSEEDGHRVDPRYNAGWKPFVNFPCGLVEADGNWLCSFGINDWACAIATLNYKSMVLGAADGSDIRPRFFRAKNGSVPVKVTSEYGTPQNIEWIVPRSRTGMVSAGYMKISNPRQAQDIADLPNVSEVDETEYEKAISMAMATR